MQAFDRELLRSQLEELSPRSRAVFALACAEKLLPFYHAFSERNTNSDWPYLRSIANRLWDHLYADIVTCDYEFLEKYPSLAPNDDWPTYNFTLLNPLAENAVLALGSASECNFSMDGECAALAADQAFEAVYYVDQHMNYRYYTRKGW